MQAILQAAKAVGGQARLAELLQITRPTINQWARGLRPVPISRCAAIEQATGGAVTRRDLRPDDWQRIWPELADASPHPPVARAAPGQAAINSVAKVAA